jgi:hypothetical protein
LASDGRWYPPATSSTTPSIAPGTYARASPATVSRGLAGTLQGFLWAAAGLAAIATIIGLVGLAALNRYWDARPGSADERQASDDLVAADDALDGILGFSFIVALVIFVLIIIWGNQAHKVTQRLWPGPRTWSAGWTIGGWFIPFANLVIPRLVFSEIEKIGRAPRSGGYVTPGWRQQSTSVVGWIWWVTFVIGYVASTPGFSMFDDPAGDIDSWRAGYVLVAAGEAVLVVAGITGALYVRRLTRALRQDQPTA